MKKSAMQTSQPDALALRIKQLSVGYRHRSIVSQMTMPPLYSGQLTALIGPNGAGKSTLLRGIAGLHPASGHIELGGHDFSRQPQAERARQLVYVPQSLPAGSKLSAFEAILAAAMAGQKPVGLGLNRPASAQLDAVEQLLGLLNIDTIAHQPLATLSGGQRQLVGLAQALIRRPQVMLLDEPTSALDLYHQCQVIDAILSATREHGLISLMVVHDINLALRYADQVLVLHEGQLVAHGAPGDIITPDLLAQVYQVKGHIAQVNGRYLLDIEGRLSP